MSASSTTYPRLFCIRLLASYLPRRPNLLSTPICDPTICGAPCSPALWPLPDVQPPTTALLWSLLRRTCQRPNLPDNPHRLDAGSAPSAFWRNDSRRLPPPVHLQTPPRIRCPPSSLKSPRCERRSTRTANLPLPPTTPAHAPLPPRLDPRPSSSRTLAYASPWNTATTRSALALPRRICRRFPTPDF
jgi:hypothetical protein